MRNFKFYHVSKRYLSYIAQYDEKIPRTQSDTKGGHDRFFCGIVLRINGVNYFAPVSSKIKPMASNIIITNRKDQPLGSIGLSHMFPVPLSEVKIKDFSAAHSSLRYPKRILFYRA